jgi:hypothetical protein
MQKFNNQAPSSLTIPEGYQEDLHWRVTEEPGRVILIQILGVILFILFGVVFSYLAVRLGKMPQVEKIYLIEIGSIFVASLLVVVLHELIHGWVMQMFGAKPEYGILWKSMMFFTTSPGYAYPRNQYVVVALAPFVLISILFILGIWLLQGTLWVALLGICGTINASGAVGDMWITAIVLRYAPHALIVDERDGIRVFLPKG